MRPILVFLISFFVIDQSAQSETSIRSEETLKIAHYLWHNDFIEAINGAEILARNEPANPVGRFMLGGIYQTISEEYRTDRYKDTVIKYLDSAITLANERKESDLDNADWYFIAGASQGYRALYRAFHGNWWGAFKDGLQCSANLSKSLELDSSFYDAYYALGAYHYWKTTKSKIFLWLPFVRDRREEGISEIKETIEHGYLATFNARETLLRVYLNEERFNEALALADSMNVINPRDPYCLLYYTQGLIATGQIDDANEKLRSLRAAWKKSQFYDPFGFYEAEYYSAQIFLKKGDQETARRIINKILSDKKKSKNNAYFAETVDKAEALLTSF